MYDLHIHSTASDGVLSPVEIIDNAIEIGLDGIAITDHDTIDGLSPAFEYNEHNKDRLKLIPGIEMNTEFAGEEVHILGYFIDYANERLLRRLAEIRQARFDRARKMVDKLRSMGFIISFDNVQKLALGDLIGRPHIAQALVEKGYVFSIKEAFDKYIGKGRPAYVPRYKFEPEEALEMVREANGISVLAHPGLIKDQQIIKDIIGMGVEGLEVFYPEHSESQINNYMELSRRKGLLVTGGSDFHGTGSGESRSRMGCAGINQDYMSRITAYYQRKM